MWRPQNRVAAYCTLTGDAPFGTRVVFQSHMNWWNAGRNYQGKEAEKWNRKEKKKFRRTERDREADTETADSDDAQRQSQLAYSSHPSVLWNTSKFPKRILFFSSRSFRVFIFLRDKIVLDKTMWFIKFLVICTFFCHTHFCYFVCLNMGFVNIQAAQLSL